MNNENLIDIETKLAYQEDLLNQLNEVIVKQQKQIDQLELTCKTLMNRISDININSSDNSNSIVDEKPPHY